MCALHSGSLEFVHSLDFTPVENFKLRVVVVSEISMSQVQVGPIRLGVNRAFDKTAPVGSVFY
jgi:hypothetical protein